MKQRGDGREGKMEWSRGGGNWREVLKKVPLLSLSHSALFSHCRLETVRPLRIILWKMTSKLRKSVQTLCHT